MSLLTGIVAYWKLDENTGTSAADATGNSHTGTLTGSPAWTTGKINSGLSFGGTSDYVDVASFPLSNAVSTSCWIKATSFSHAYNAIVSCIGNSNDYYSSLVKSNGTLAIYLFAANQVDYDGTGATTLSTGTWYHVVLTYDSTSGLVGYVNGSVDGTAAANGSIGAISGELRIASQSNAAGREFDGVIDEVGIWSRALTSAEVTQLYNSGAGLQYPFSGGATSSLFRQNNLTGIGSGGPFFQNPLTRSMLGWRKKLSGILIPDPVFA